MEAYRPKLFPILALTAALLLGACQDNVQSPPARPELPLEQTGPEEDRLGPIDLIYVCGKTFLATNATGNPVQVEYRVVGTDEAGSLTLPGGADEHHGYSETEFRTANRGPVELYQDGERVARRRNETTACGAAPSSARFAAATSADAGSWSAPFPWRGVAVHLNLLPTGKVLSFGEFVAPQVWNPATGSFTSVPSPILLFCGGHSFLADGRLLVSGGHIGPDRGFPDNTIFNPSSESWSRSTPMRQGRWYPTNTTLGSGDVVILAGADEDALRVLEPEVWSGGAVRVLSTADRSLAYYPRAFLAPNGRVFYAGHAQMTRYLNPVGTGSWTNVGNRLYGVRDYGAAVMYDVGKILYMGGGRTTNTAEIIDLNSAAPAWRWTGSMAFPRRHLNATVLPTGEVLVTGGTSGTTFNDLARAVHAAELWNPATGRWTTLASNTVRRGYHSTSILLPDGRVLHSGSGDTRGQPSEENAELFSPPYLFRGPRPTISAAPSSVGYGTSFRVSTPDAADIEKISLVRLGSTTHAFDMNQRFQWLSFTRSAGELNVSVPSNRNHTPPGHYLLFILDGNGVPSVARIVRVGSDGTGPPAPPPPPSTSISLTVTGREDATKQYMTLKWSGAAGATVDVYRNGPYLTNTANDGIYTNSRNFVGPASYTYKVCQVGTTTCSNTATVTFGGASPPPSNAPPAASFTSSCSGLSCAFTDGSTDADGTVAGWSWAFGDGATATARNPSRTYAAAGTYTVTLTVTDDDGATHQRSAPVTVTAASAMTLSVTGREDATKQYMTLKWSGAAGATVDVYRNGPYLTNTANDGIYTNSRNFVGPASYTYKVCQAGTTTCSNTATVTFGGASPPPSNAPPAASFTSSCSGLSCAFTDGSTDADGTVAGWSWAFGDGATSTARHPSRTYAAAGTYTVTLTVTDNDGATHQRSAPVTVTAASAMTLSVTGRTDATKQHMTLRWTGASGSTVEVYRNGPYLTTTANDGIYTNSRNFVGPASYTYKVCQVGTSICSNEATVVFQ